MEWDLLKIRVKSMKLGWIRYEKSYIKKIDLSALKLKRAKKFEWKMIVEEEEEEANEDQD